MKFEDAQDIAYRFAAASYIRKLKELVGEADVMKLAGTHSRHNTLMARDDRAIAIKVAIECSSAMPCADLDALISETNKVTPR